MRPGDGRSLALTCCPLCPGRVRDAGMKATTSQRGVFPPPLVCSPRPLHSCASSGIPSLEPRQASSQQGSAWCLGGPGSARGSPHTILPLAALPPALSRHTYLSCPTRLGLLPSEPGKEATGQGRDRDKDAEQEWQKDGGDRAQEKVCSPEEEKPGWVEDASPLTTGSLAKATTCPGGIPKPLGQQPCLVPPSPRPPWARMGKDTEGRD